MPLDASCEGYKGDLIFVLPIVGFGWCRLAPDTPSHEPGDAVEPPEAFHTRLLEWHYFVGSIRAGIGMIEQPNHLLDKQ